MIYLHFLGRALRFYSGRTALARNGRLLTFRELHTRVESIAGTLTSHGFGVGDRLALLLPNGPDYIELLYACNMLGVIAIPLNIRLSKPKRLTECSKMRVRVGSCPIHPSLSPECR
jgi:acyl-CoA synthetase (AMP-forming)/AMP-acid ligase II